MFSFTATFIEPEKLRNDLSATAFCLAKIVCLKKAVSKRTAFYFSASSVTVHEDLLMF